LSTSGPPTPVMCTIFMSQLLYELRNHLITVFQRSPRKRSVSIVAFTM
jgi:hypothetical protein